MKRVNIKMSKTCKGQDVEDNGNPRKQLVYSEGKCYSVGPSLAKTFVDMKAGKCGKEADKALKKEEDDRKAAKEERDMRGGPDNKAEPIDASQEESEASG